MLTRRAALGGLALLPVAAPAIAGLFRPSLADDSPPLHALAASRGLFFGGANNNYWLGFDDFAAAYLRDCAMLVPEYELKRFLTEPEPGHYDFSATDALLAFSRKHGLRFRGHTLVWFAANPPWLEQAVLTAGDERIFTDYIQTAAGRYRGAMHSWDVVNEAIEPADGRADGLRDTCWLKRFGSSHIDTAYHAAREADPGALLVYNDYGLEQEGPVNDARRKATLALLEGMVARGVPVGALGLQGHINAFNRTLNQATLARFLSEVQQLGLRILVTEHDVDDSGGPIDYVSRDRAVADASRRLLDVVLDNTATLGVLTWGYSDRFLKPEGERNALLRGTPRMLPLDGEMAPTPMRAAIAQAFEDARKR
jgi:endo-1,4-beta-xylanase